jgi:hypothetical protein
MDCRARLQDPHYSKFCFSKMLRIRLRNNFVLSPSALRQRIALHVQALFDRSMDCQWKTEERKCT